MAKKLLEYLYTDIKLVSQYSEQVRDEIQQMLVETFPDHVPNRPDSELSLHDKIVLIEAFLKAQNDVSYQRPVQMNEQDNHQSCRFVLEAMTAQKIIIPSDEYKGVEGLSQIAIWISDPEPQLYSHKPYDWRGTFLYLTECHWDNHGFSTVFSGVSALQAVINQITGKNFLDYVNEEFEPYGRGRDLHPIDKLKDIGGIATETRKIKSLYRKRYLTNEQAYQYEGERRRVNDLLGYPLYIISDD